MTWRELRTRIVEAGGIRIRSGRGSREVWRLGSKTVTLQTAHQNAQVSKRIQARIQNAIEAAR